MRCKIRKSDIGRRISGGIYLLFTWEGDECFSVVLDSTRIIDFIGDPMEEVRDAVKKSEE